MIKPDRQDYEEVEGKYGRLPEDAPNSVVADHDRLAQAAKIIRLYHECATVEELAAAIAKERAEKVTA